jgi:hypothetical protein
MILTSAAIYQTILDIGGVPGCIQDVVGWWQMRGHSSEWGGYGVSDHSGI